MAGCSKKMPEHFVYRLCGFSADLDWRPTFFKEPFGPVAVCSICGVVPKSIALLPCCRHTLCESCHGNCLKKGRVCLLDRKQFDDNLVQWLDITEETLNAVMAFCWNAEQGCDFLGSVMNLKDHYHNGCCFHAVVCPRCKMLMVQADIVYHFDVDCAPLPVRKTSTAEGSYPGLTEDVSMAVDVLSGDDKLLRSAVGVLINSVTVECSNLKERLSTEADKLKEQYTKSATAILGKQEVLLSDMNRRLNEHLSGGIDALSEGVSAAIQNVSNRTECDHCRSVLHWRVHDWGEMKERASKGFLARAEGTATYLRGYNVLPVADLVKGDRNKLEFWYFVRIEKGKWDSGLEWPFRKTYKLSVVHPQDVSRSLCETVNAEAYPDEDAFQGAGVPFHGGFGTREICTLDKIEGGGFLTKDSLKLTLTIAP